MDVVWKMLGHLEPYESRILRLRPQSAGVVATDVIGMGLVGLIYRLHGNR